MANTESDYFVSQILDDEDLDYITEVLWQGYSPSPRLRYDLELYPRVGWKLHQKPQKSLASVDLDTLPPAEVPKPVAQPAYEHHYTDWGGVRERAAKRRARWQGSTYTCDRCKRRLWSPGTDADAEQEFLATFGEPLPDAPPRYVLCPPCYEVMLATYAE